jgi:FtsH-binding integral membrane protein
VLSAFTVAHSVTLAATVLGWAHAPGQVVEPLIAASVAVVAAGNLLRPHARVHVPRWAIAFGFGLVHGFGFAGAIADVEIPAERIWQWLLAFNLGVELGQIVFAAAGATLLYLCARHTRQLRRIAIGANAVLLVAGCAWMAERIAA